MNLQLSPEVDALWQALEDRELRLRFRCNRKKLFHFGQLGQGGRGLVVHPRLFAAADFGRLVLQLIDGDRSRQTELQHRVNHLGNDLQTDTGTSVVSDWPLFNEASSTRIDALEADLANHAVGLTFSDNDVQMLSLKPDKTSRRRGRPSWRLDLHYRVLLQAGACEDLSAYARQRGHGDFPCLDAGVANAFATIQAQLRLGLPPMTPATTIELAERDYTTIGTGFDFPQRLRAIQTHYFPELEAVDFRWGRDPGQRHLKSIRWGSYCHRPKPMVSLHPRLRRPWVAELFVDHVLHHELCHHLQACQPERGERPHGPRFRRLEAAFPQLEAARTWERRFLDAMLAPD